MGSRTLLTDGMFGHGSTKWADYKNGFGTPNSDEYWMGLDEVHNLTKTGSWEIMFKAKWDRRSTHNDFKGYWAYVVYSGFKVDDECDQYRLHIGSRLRSNRIGFGTFDYFRHQNGKIFRSSDRNPSSCTGNGAWWHKEGECRYACFNCKDRVWHDSYGRDYYADSTEMFIRKT